MLPTACLTMLGALCGSIPLVDLSYVIAAMEAHFAGKTRFVASGTTAVLDESLRNKYEKLAQLVEQNARAIEAAYEHARRHPATPPRP